MKCCKISIDLDDKIIEFCKDNIDENIDIEKYIQNIVEMVLEEQNINVDEVTVSITSATKEEIKAINSKYRGIEKETDVLSFPIFTAQELDDISKQKDDNKKIKIIELGDIIICLDIVKVQAVSYNTGIFRELLYMITHGMCHLVGYDHIEESDKIKMRALEEKILNKLGVKR